MNVSEVVDRWHRESEKDLVRARGGREGERERPGRIQDGRAIITGRLRCAPFLFSPPLSFRALTINESGTDSRPLVVKGTRSSPKRKRSAPRNGRNGGGLVFPVLFLFLFLLYFFSLLLLPAHPSRSAPVRVTAEGSPFWKQVREQNAVIER